MARHPTYVVVLALVMSMVIPATALACPIKIRRLGPIDILRTQLIRPTSAVVPRAAWKRDNTWESVRPRLEQFVRIRGGYTGYAVAYPMQRALSIDAYGPQDNGWMYFDDDVADTPPCQLRGQIEWQVPKVSVYQTRTQVRVLAAAQRTVGDRTGCILGPDYGVRRCPNLARTVVMLKAPIGNRKIVFESFDTSIIY